MMSFFESMTRREAGDPLSTPAEMLAKAGIDLVARLAKVLETSISDLLPEAETPDPSPLLREQVGKLTETLKAVDRDTLSMLVPLLARLLESPTRRR